jgi:hypothetical protein
MTRVVERPLWIDSPNLFSGTAGLGLALMYFAESTGDDRYLDAAVRIADAGRGILDERPELLNRAGLMRGWSGLALLLIRLYERVGEPRLLDAAARALRADLDRCVLGADGTLQFDEGWRLLPYVEAGSAGVGLVLNEFLAHRSDESLAAYNEGIRLAATPEVVIHSGLFNGRAGLLLYLHGVRPTPATTIEAHVARMAWHAVPYRGHTTFVGDQLARLSMDLATGSAGVLLALAAVLDERPITLPFLRRAPWVRATTTSSSPDRPAEPRPFEGR